MKQTDSSFRDPDGFVFEHNGEIFRAVNFSYQKAYDHLLSSGLYKKLIDRGLIVPFEEIDSSALGIEGYYKILRPEQVLFISYPFEWSFTMLKDAALLTLEIQRIALNYGMSLKDASAFNVQFKNGHPIFIDTLSFEMYPVNRPWIAYRQFCQHFLAPLALMANVDPGLNRLFIIYIDGIPLELAKKMLPFRSRLSLSLFLHIFLHSKAQKKYNSSSVQISQYYRKFSLSSMRYLLSGLRSAIENQRWNPIGTEWADYTSEGVHKKEYIEFKTKTISSLLDRIKPQTVWDLGANTGNYSRIASDKGCHVISFDMDPSCVEKNYSIVRKNKYSNVLPLLMDLLNPSPSLGWRGAERLSIYSRNKPDLILALGIFHHLTMSANIPIESIASHFASLAKYLIIEFVPKDDEKVQLLLLSREDIFKDYTQDKFETIFSKHYRIEQTIQSSCNQRVFYLMIKNE